MESVLKKWPTSHLRRQLQVLVVFQEVIFICQRISFEHCSAFLIIAGEKNSFISYLREQFIKSEDTIFYLGNG